MTHEHPEWRRLYTAGAELIAGGKDFFNYEELQSLSGVDIRTPRGRQQFLRFRMECLTKLSIWLENVRGEGYRVIPANAHVDSASIRVNRAKRMTGRALRIATNTRFEELTNQEKKLALDVQSAIGTLYLAAKETVKETRRIAGSIEHPKLAQVIQLE
jgi:hypothetical protein